MEDVNQINKKEDPKQDEMLDNMQIDDVKTDPENTIQDTKNIKKGKWKIYKKKTSSLKKRIFVNILASIMIMVATGGIYIYDSALKKDDSKELKKINSYISDLEDETSEIKEKINDAQKYQKSWDVASDRQKDLSGIKMDEVNNIVSKLSKEYNIKDPKITVSLPEIIKDSKYNNDSINVTLSNVSLAFDSSNDIVAMGFIKEFIDSLKGYISITKISIRRTKDEYKNEDFISMSSGKVITGTKASIDFSWYVLKEKPKKTKKK